MTEKDTQWKQKYYDSLDDLELREKKWQTLEDLLKQAISRLTIAAEGRSNSLDNNLKQLRTAIRKDKDNEIIHTILENVSREILKLDQQPQSGATDDAGFLLKIIEQMHLSGQSEKKSRWLVKQLKSKNPPEQSELLKNFSELLSEVIEQVIREADLSRSGNKKSGNGGFFKNLFSAGESTLTLNDDSLTEQNTVVDADDSKDDVKESFETVPATAADNRKTIGLNQEQLSSVVCTVQNVLESIIDGFEVSEDVKQKLKDKVFEVSPTREIHVLLGDLKDILAGTGKSEMPGNEETDVIEHHDLLIRLIEFLPLEESIKAKAEQLKDDFSRGVSTEQLPQALKSIADLVSKMRSNVQQEQKEFELFLKSLTDRLKQVDQYLQSNLKEHQKSYQNSVNLDNAVKEQVKGLGDYVASINNLEEMERVVQTHLDKIVTHIDLHRSAEDKRIADIEYQNKQLSEQLGQLEIESSELRQQVIASQNQALIDPLTQLPNRMAYEQRLKQEYARWKRYNSILIIMVWDIDYFKQVNDNYGHQAGDKVLKVVAELLHNNLREVDFIARFGGEEFVSLMPETTLGGGFKVAEKIRAAIEQLEFHYRGSNVKVTISCGITLFMENDTTKSAFSRADKALYQAKSQGRNRCVIAAEPSV